MAKKHGLGRGLGALIKDGTAARPAAAAAVTTAAAAAQAKPKEFSSKEAPAEGVRTVSVRSIKRNSLQPRRHFEPEALAELTESIKVHGVLQPLLVRSSDGEFELIAGERRLRACIEAGLKEVPVLVVDAPDVLALELALVENLQREDLNALEEAEGYRALADRFEMTQERIAERVGKSRATVANAMRLLSLADEVKRMLADEVLSPGHAKALLGLEIPEEQVLVARRAAKEGLSVREVEKVVRRAREAPRRPRVARADIPDTHLRYLSDRLHGFFGTSVRITPCRTYANGKKSKGSLEVDFYSTEDLNRILEVLGLTEE